MLAIASSTDANPNGFAISTPGDEVRDHVPRAEHLGRVEDPPVPLRPPDVALLARADDREQALVPDLVVRVVDRDPVVLVALHVLARQRLRDDLADPAAREALLDRLRVAAVEVGLREPVDLRGHRPAGERVRVRRPVVVLGDDRERLEHVLDRLDPGVRAAGLLVLAPVVVDVAEAALLLGAEVLAEPEHGQVDQVAPLDRRRGLHHRLAVRERVPVVRRHRRELDVRDSPALERQAARRATRYGDAGFTRTETIVRRSPYGPPVSAISSGGRRARRLAELGERLLVEREDEVRLRLDRAVEVVATAPTSSNAIPVRSRSSFSTASAGTRRVALDQRLDQRRARLTPAHRSSWTKRSSGTSRELADVARPSPGT